MVCKMAKVRFRARVNLSTGYIPVKYITRTIEMEIPKDQYGLIIMRALHKPIREYFQKNTIHEINEKVSSFSILNCQIVTPA